MGHRATGCTSVLALFCTVLRVALSAGKVLCMAGVGDGSAALGMQVRGVVSPRSRLF